MRKNKIIEIFLALTLVFFSLSSVLALSNQEALLEINNSRTIIENMHEKGFSIVFVNDTLLEAERVYQQAFYADILRNSSNKDSTSLKEATAALRLVNWKDISFEDVLSYTSIIADREKQAYEVYDELVVLNKNIEQYKNRNLDVSSVVVLYNNANESFYMDRYEEAITTIQEARNELEKINEEQATLKTLGRGFKEFLLENWHYILIVLIILFIISYYATKITKKFLLRKKIVRMKIEQKVLEDLIKETQEHRFKYNKISGLVYNIRMKKYNEKIQGIKEELPVLEDKLRKMERKG